MTLVPIGTNCTTGIALVKVNLRKHAFPFDYIDTSSYAYIRKVLVLKQNEVDNFVNQYFNGSDFDKITCKHKDAKLITDYYNNQNQISGFCDNRHDQSILSLVCNTNRRNIF